MLTLHNQFLCTFIISFGSCINTIQYYDFFFIAKVYMLFRLCRFSHFRITLLKHHFSNTKISNTEKRIITNSIFNQTLTNTCNILLKSNVQTTHYKFPISRLFHLTITQILPTWLQCTLQGVWYTGTYTLITPM